MFGHTINLNFDQQGSAHKTIVGGVISIFLKVFLGILLILNIVKMYKRDSNNNSTLYELVKLSEIGVVSFNETKLFPFHVIRKQASG